MGPYSLPAGEGWTFDYGIPHTVKLGELAHGRGAAIFEYRTKRAKNLLGIPTRPKTKFSMCWRVASSFTGADADFPVSTGGVMFLPKGIAHGYTIASEGEVRLLVVTFPTMECAGKGWGGYLADVESQGEFLSGPGGA